MPPKIYQSTVELAGSPRPLCGAPCQCLAEFYREEFRKHHSCLEQHREYYSAYAISQAEEAIGDVMQRIEELCRREDACEVVGQLLRKFESVTRLSSFEDPRKFN
jgi:hypothetical protein